jgi:hypothetical protein
MPPDVPAIPDAALAVMRTALRLALADARAGETVLAFVVVGGDEPRVEQMAPGPDVADPVRVSLDMAHRSVADLPRGTAYAVARDAILHDPPGKSDAVIIEFGLAGAPERHYAAQKYRRPRWLRRVRTIGGLIYLAQPRFAAAGQAPPAPPTSAP